MSRLTIVTCAPGTPFLELLTAQIGNEFAAAQQYLAIAAYFDGADLPQLARRCYRQAVKERNHAMMIVRYLIDQNMQVAIPGVPAVVSHFDCVRQPVELALNLERTLTERLTRFARAARDEGDHGGERFLKAQIEAVATMTTLLTFVDRADNLFQLENFVAREPNAAAPADSAALRAAGGAVRISDQ